MGVDEARRAQFECFVRLSRRRHRAVLATMDDAVLLSRGARDLNPVDQAAILRMAGEAKDAVHGRILDVELGAASSVSVKIHAESDRIRFPSVVLEVIPGSTRRRLRSDAAGQKGLAGLVGTSHAWRSVCEAAESASRSDIPVLLSGEPGTGKLAVARALHAAAGRRDVAVLDVASVVVEGEQQWLRDLRRALSGDGTVIVAHLHLCRGPLAAGVAAEIGMAAPQGRLVGTVTTGHTPDAEVASLLDRFSVRLQIPTLRDRRDDIEALVSCFVHRHAPERSVRFHPGAVAILRSVEFGDNARELERIVAGVVATRRGDILAGHLPPLNQRTPAYLTAMELAERDAIVRTMQEMKGNKAAAAARLGISRATLYRKLGAYGIHTADAIRWNLDSP